MVVTGGASVGERDHGKAMFAPAGLALIFSKVAIKPGKPIWFGRAGGKLVGRVDPGREAKPGLLHSALLPRRQELVAGVPAWHAGHIRGFGS